MRSSLPARLIYRAAVTVRGETSVYRYIPELKRTLSLSDRELREQQSVRLAELLTLAGRQSLFYRRAWSRSGVDGTVAPNASLALHARLPLIRKREIQEQGASMIVTPHGKASWKATGGSTAEPVRILKGADGIAREMAASWAHLSVLGISIGDPSVRFWSMPLRRRAKIRGRLADLAMNRLRFSAFSFEHDRMAAHWEQCLAFRPRWLYGYASMIDYFAGWIESVGYDGRRLQLNAVVPTSEPMDDGMRERLKRVFGCPVMNEYGCGEVGPIAYSCANDRLHTVTDNLLVEILRDDGTPAGEGEKGEVVLTDLTNHVMPLIRYRMGDLAEVGGSCSCGRQGPTLRRVLGRTYDQVQTPSGRRWNGWEVHYLLSTLQMELGDYKQYQIVQDGPDTLDVRLVADAPIRRETELRIATYIAQHLDGMRARVRRVEAVERSASGKLRVVRNDWRPPEEASSQN